MKRIESLEAEINSTNFWQDKDNSEKVIEELKTLKSIVEDITNLIKDLSNNIELLTLANETNDEDTINEVEKQLENYKDTLEKKELLLLLNGEHDTCNCILEIHPGAGGTESCDWALMLFRMYTRWCEKNSFKSVF